MLRLQQVIIMAVILLTSIGCQNVQYPITKSLVEVEKASPPADDSIVGTWRFARAGDHHILFPFIMKFDKSGIHTSGPTPYALSQKANYSFDGSTISIGKEEDPVVIPNVTIKGNTMTMIAEDGGEPILVTYHRIWPW